MKSVWVVCLLVCMAYSAAAENAAETEMLNAAPEGRFLYFNSSSTSTTLTMLGAVILLGVIFYLVYVGDLLSPASGYNRNGYGYEQGEYAQYDSQYPQYRSSKSGYDFNALNIIQWISMLQDVYEKFDMNDLECQKRLVCEITREPEYFGTFSRSARSGFKYANSLAKMITLPDDINELLDEYTDASNTGETSQKECSEFFQCPYSIKDSIRKNIVGNDL